MRVLLAGGGTAGHTSPLLATADAIRRLAPDLGIEVEITCLGTPRGLENRVVPEAGYPLELIPPVPLPRKPNADLLQGPRSGCARPSRRRSRSSTGSDPTSSSATAATSRCRPTSPPGGASCRCSSTSRTPYPGMANKARRPGRAARRRELPGHPAAEGGVRRAADPPDDLRARPGRAARRGAGVLRPRPRPPDAAGHRRLAGCPQAQPVGLRRRAPRWPPPASRCCTSSARRARPRPRPAATCPTSWSTSSTGWTSPTPPPTWWSAAAGASSVTEAAAVGLPGDLRAAADRQRRAGAQRPPDRRRRAAACWSPTPT